MEQRDLLKDQIEQLGKVLAKILSDFLGFKSSGNITQGIEISNESLQSELDIDIEKIMTLNKTELDEYIRNRQLTEIHLELLSEYLKEVGLAKSKIDNSDAHLCLQKAIELLDVADEISKTMSFDRINKKSEIKNVLQQNV
ncbi:hypothetical protein [Tenacibaculum sp. nBUS_03]|uniref:hypothetical protein n=1 Tax=Tenacibaculum sp. nBUS_03 TaxID=3395320 RepID=UPI003EB9C515